ncbi:FHA domain-containing protein [Fontivita pretiosa]|uniref:FHA domain-containing protein n=1 Tax=Fontivita pretiosa TaxID=2989684 RepID=UPI003D17C836
MAYLVVYGPTSPPQRMKLDQAVTIGRAMGCDLWRDDPKLSRRHCRIERQGDEWVLIDLGSTNGTYYRNKRIKSHKLNDGDTFEAGNLRIVFREGDLIEYRPKDPIEAATMPAKKFLTGDPSASTIVWSRPLPVARVDPPAPRIDKAQSGGDKPLAFLRPPARPMPKALWPEAARRSPSSVDESHWLSALLSRFRGR